MLIFLEDVAALMEQMVPLIGSHIGYLARESEEEGSEILATSEIPVNLQVNTDFLPMAIEEIEDLRIGISSGFGVSSSNCYAVFIGWKSPICNLLTSAIAVWAMTNQSLPSIRITRSLPPEQFQDAMDEYLGLNKNLDQFDYAPEFEGAIPISFVKDYENDFLKWEFYGPEVHGLQKFLRSSLGITPFSNKTYEGIPQLLLSFST